MPVWMSTLLIAIAIAVVVALWAHAMTRQFPAPTQLRAINNAIWKRYTRVDLPTGPIPADNQPERADSVIAYVERIVDRQINKARGILPFNSIIIAALSFEKARSAQSPVAGGINLGWLLLFVTLGLAISSALCLRMFFVRWTSTDYGYFHLEFESTMEMIVRRSKIVEWATVIALASLIVGVALIAAIEFLARP